MSSTQEDSSDPGSPGDDRPGFLTLPPRDAKPRGAGITHVLDKGTPLPLLEAMLYQRASLVDIVKFGWGTAYVDPTVKQRIKLCVGADVRVCLGGTLLEVCAAQDRVTELCSWAAEIGVDTLEVSNGLQMMDRRRKHELIRTLSQDFRVVAETGTKLDEVPVVPSDWIGELESDLEAGAGLVITEGRESGTVGLYDGNGAVRTELVDAIADRLPVERIIFEAPRKHQQIWLIRRFGAGVNLGNVTMDDVIALETSRLGLRADTAGLVSGARAGAVL